jgi:hypothetical protein
MFHRIGHLEDVQERLAGAQSAQILVDRDPAVPERLGRPISTVR